MAKASGGSRAVESRYTLVGPETMLDMGSYRTPAPRTSVSKYLGIASPVDEKEVTVNLGGVKPPKRMEVGNHYFTWTSGDGNNWLYASPRVAYREAEAAARFMAGQDGGRSISFLPNRPAKWPKNRVVT